jgi:hypothetical protein
MKNKINIYIALLSMSLIIASCSSSGGDDSPPPPPPNTAPTAVSTLTFPSSDLLCIDNTVAFQWSAATDADGDPITYKLVVATDRPLTQIVEERTVSSTSVTISLNRGVAYYWRVTAMDNQGAESDPSATFAFYTEGEGVSNYAPFTAALNAPANEGSVAAGTVNLSWTGGDTNAGDTLTYELFFGEATDPPSLQTDLTADNFDVTAATGLTYYWRVDTTDDSGLKTIGQVWTFSVN